MPSQHAILSASGSNKWIHCHPSARLEELFEEKPSVYAAEGTEAHSVAEQKLRNWIEGHPRRKVKAANGEMDEATNFYKDYVLEVYNKEKKKSDIADLFIEVQVDLSPWIPEGFGTSDAVIVSNHTLHIIDFKYGEGVKVNAPHNPQLTIMPQELWHYTTAYTILKRFSFISYSLDVITSAPGNLLPKSWQTGWKTQSSLQLKKPGTETENSKPEIGASSARQKRNAQHTPQR